jgi:hypothetical protein
MLKSAPERLAAQLLIAALSTPSPRRSAITAIGTEIDRVAAKARTTVPQLLSLLSKSADLGFGLASKRLFYACKGLAAPEGPEPGPQAAPGDVGPIPPTNADPTDLSLAFKLHSRPGAPRRIVLDFTGHITTGTGWNEDYGLDPIVTPPYDIDGVPGSFSNTELSNIISIWRGVAEDFAAFDVSAGSGEEGRVESGAVQIAGVRVCQLFTRV